jgi:tetratricopeptide (TPR) repeat protein
MPPLAAALLIETLAGAVQAAHEQGIIHRDLKPANVLLQIADRRSQIEKPNASTSGQSAILNLQSAIPKIADFGLAKRLDDADEQTAAGAVLGTPSYMAPEQAGQGPQSQEQGAAARAIPIGPAVDVYALGAILYETLSGRPPFKGASTLETLDQVRYLEPVPPSRFRPGVPRDLQTICLKCLEKNPRKRYDSAAVLAADLRRFRQGEPIKARPVQRWERMLKWSRRRPAAAALVFISGLATLILVAGTLWYNARLQGEVRRAEAGEAAARRQQERADEDYRAARAALSQMLGRLNDPQLAQVPRLQELRQHQLVDAQTFYRSLLREGEPLDPTMQYDVARAFQEAAIIQQQMGQLDSARHNFQQAIGLLEELVVRCPAAVEYSAQLGCCYNGMGCSYGDSAVDQSRTWFEKGRQVLEKLNQAHPDLPSCQEALAMNYHNLAGQALQRGDAADVELYEKALALRRHLLAASPYDPQVTVNAAIDCQALGLVYAFRKQPDRAEAVYRQGEELLKGLIVRMPQDPTPAAMLAGIYSNWAILENGRSHFEAAVRLTSRGVELAEEIVRKEPNYVNGRTICVNVHGERAHAYEGLKRYAQAATEWRRCVELSDESLRVVLRIFQARDQLFAGDCSGGGTAIWELAANPKTTGDALYEVAELLTFAAGLVLKDASTTPARRSAEHESYVRQAIESLQRLRDSGYFKNPENMKDLQETDRLDNLRSRPEFQKLLREMNAASINK